jgi:hypothetical protein
VVEEIGRGTGEATTTASSTSMNVKIDDLAGVLNHLQGQGKSGGKAKKRA